MYHIRSVSGPLKGQKFLVKGNLKLGRRKGDIVLNDPSASDPHAQITQDSSGRLFLKDLNSKNGTFVGGQKKSKSVLRINDKFTIGKNKFQVLFLKTPAEIGKAVLTDSLFRMSNRLKAAPFVRPLDVKFLSGPQKGMSFYLTYGPRYFGSLCVDVPLSDRKAPGRAFTVSAKKDQFLFSTDFPKKVQFNGKGVKRAVLEDDNSVTFGDTKIQITFSDHPS